MKNQKPSAIPIYHGSIIRIEQHNDIDNTSDLIVRVPNFHHLSLPSLNISNLPSHDIQSNNLDSQRESRPKRRAPICPILHDLQHRFPSKTRSQSEIHSRLINTKRLAIGLRNLSRVITTTCKSKQASSVNTRPFIPALPDVEVITENFQKPTITKKTAKHENSTSKFFTPKFLFIKRKHFRTKKQQTTLKPIDIENSNKHSTIDESSTKINVKDVESEQPKEATSTTIPIQITTDGKTSLCNISIELCFYLKFLAEPKTETIEKLIPNIPIFAIDPESTSTHRYCTIPRSPSDPHTVITDDTVSSMDLSRSIFQSNTSISKEKNDSTTGVEILININNTQTQDYNENIEDRIHVVHPNGDTYSEYYEVTYELDPECQNIIHDEKSIQLSLDPVKYDELSKVVSTWLPSLPDDTPSHNYDEVEDHNINESYEKTRENLNITSLEISPKITRVKFQSLEDTSQISNDPSTSIIFHNEFFFLSFIFIV